jgi:hypothetical protein
MEWPCDCGIDFLCLESKAFFGKQSCQLNEL